MARTLDRSPDRTPGQSWIGATAEPQSRSQDDAAVAKSVSAETLLIRSTLAASERVRLQLVFEVLVVAVVGELVERAGAG